MNKLPVDKKTVNPLPVTPPPVPKVYDTDKVENGLLAEYENLFKTIKNNKLNILEVGVYKGGSLLWAKDYFPNSNINGMDIVLPKKPLEGITLFIGNQNDDDRLKDVAKKCGGPLDIIIDDGCHKRNETFNTFNQLWKYVRPGGWYVIEDWVAGFWEEYPEYAGLVEMVQKIVKARSNFGISDVQLIIKDEKCSYAALRKAKNRGFSI